jgi:hypothetical protein
MKINEYLKVTGKVKVTICNVLTGKKRSHEYKNMFVNTGKYAIARRLRNEAGVTSESIITYGATGTGSNAPVATDTALQTELARAVVASSSRTNNASTFRVFYTTAESNGVLKEFGCFGEAASAVANSGTLFNRVAINITKTSSETMTVEAVITIS